MRRTIAIVVAAAIIAAAPLISNTAYAATPSPHPTKTRIAGKTPDGFCPTKLAYLVDLAHGEKVVTHIHGGFDIQAWSSDKTVLRTVLASGRKHHKTTVSKLTHLNPEKVSYVEIVSPATKHYAESDCHVSYKTS
jgi:hypothetical protein